MTLKPLNVLAAAAGILPAAALPSLAAPPVSPAPQSPPLKMRTISVDYQTVKGPRSNTWRACVGAGRVGEGMRAEWQRQLKLCREEIGFETLRCHGLLHDELGVYREDKEGHPIYNWQYIDSVYDYLLSIGIRPFVEIGFTPDALATISTHAAGPDGMADDPDHPGQKRRVTVFQWRSNVTPPKSWEKWDALITALTRHWIERYGADEVRTWRFEIWNEPNHPAFFSPNDPKRRREEYFDLYAHTARAIRAAESTLHVGGPASAGIAWVPELIEFGRENHVPVDFISYHAYGVGSGPGGFDEFGERTMYLNRGPDAVANAANSERGVIDVTPAKGLPICVTEWSASFSARDPVHDSYFEAPYILEQLRHTESLAAMSYWTFTDIFEETGIPPRPFHGGFGLLTVQGIKKPAYFAYRFLNLLGPEELANNNDSRAWVCRDTKTGSVSALFWNLTMPPAPRSGEAPVSNQTHFRKTDPPPTMESMTLSVTSLAPGEYRLSTFRVGYESNDAYTAYLKMGAPAQPTRTQETALHAAATGAPEHVQEIHIGSDKTWQGTFSLRANDAVLVTLTPIGTVR